MKATKTKKEPKFDQRGWVNWLKEQMAATTPASLWRRYTGESRSVFYEMVCHHACLRPESEDVQMAFKELCGGNQAESSE